MILLDFLNTLVPAAAIAAGTWIALRVFRVNAATRYAAWWAVLAAVVAMPLWPLEEVEPVAVEAIASFTPAAPIEVPPSTDWLAGIVLAWAAFAVYRLFRVAVSYLYLRRIQRNAQRVELARFETLRGSVRRDARLLISQDIASPMAVGFRRPAVILPQSLLERLTPAELDHVLLHELAHIARRDDWTNLAARLTAAVLGLHPVAAFALTRIAKERELACDDWVVSATGEASSYAASLTRVFELSRGRNQLLATGMTGSQLGDRVEELLAAGRRFTRGASLVTLAIIGAALLAMVVAGSQSPAWVAFAQTAPTRPVAPAPPVAPRPPAPPVAPAPPRRPARPVAPAPPSTEDFLRRMQNEIRAQEQAIVQQEMHLEEQKAELKARTEQLRRMTEEIEPRQERLREQIERLQKQLEEMKARQF